jgi:predicted RNA-binding Zn-ribbon protein involved in translation (DUF1610 family)
VSDAVKAHPPRLADGFDDDPRCVSCGSHAVFDPPSGHLTCRGCGVARDLAYHDRDAASRALRDFDPQGTPEAPSLGAGDIRSCPGCGGQVVFFGHAISTDCPYCGGPSVALGTERAYPTMALVPFAVDQATARTLACGWLGSRIAKPLGLLAKAEAGWMVGLYAPFWTFQTREDVNWVAQATGPDRPGRAVSRDLLHGTIEMTCDDILVPASGLVTGEMRDALVAGFRPGLLRVFRAGYVAGFAAERHHRTVAEGLEASRADRDLLIRKALQDRVVPSHLTNLSHRADVTSARYRRILLPIWMLHYRHRGAVYRVMVSGIDGRTFGERPYSRAAIFGVSAAITALAMALGWSFGGST